ncbi:sigma-70 family RNA polymerase sigma factor [Massilia niabensis]|uniref:Sigma-70 family RNA polymerase sigma factor n=1 Tax=Massilia niabensis TaxID=544910 RepID=A0ABW0LEI9_9BURK
MNAADDFDYDAALAACARGDQQALRSIYDRDARGLLGVALRILRRRQLAEDVLHDAFLNIWTKARSFDPARGEGRGWIYSIVRHQALSVARSSGREVQAGEDALDALDASNAESAATGAGLVDAFERQQDLGRLHDCLIRLDASKRDSILYAYVDGCSHAEIAARMQSPLGTIKAWIKRGLSALKECMG